MNKAKWMRRCTAIALSAGILAAQLPAAQALSDLSEKKQSTGTQTMQTLLDPRYSYISRISAGLDIKNGVADCGGSFTAYYDYPAKFYIMLQWSENQVTWTDLQKWSMDCSGAGPHVIGQQRSVRAGRAYRVIAHVEINGKTAECISPVKQI